jgi:hypothetical protein
MHHDGKNIVERTSVARQWLASEHMDIPTDANATWEVFSMRSLLRCYKQIARAFLGPRANAELVPKSHFALRASHAALQMLTFQNFALT